MNEKQRKNLLESIEHWKEIERGEGVDMALNSCSLCMAFPKCGGCPVHEHTGETDCSSTPWIKWNEEQLKFNRYIFHYTDTNRVADTLKLVRLARSEREFLESLLRAKS